MCKSGATIIPVFYDVKPCELRWTGRYAEALTIHEQKGRYDPRTIKDWRRVLKDVSEISGFELGTYNGLELLPLSAHVINLTGFDMLEGVNSNYYFYCST